jgi:hypothetical protein
MASFALMIEFPNNTRQQTPRERCFGIRAGGSELLR